MKDTSRPSGKVNTRDGEGVADKRSGAKAHNPSTKPAPTTTSYGRLGSVKHRDGEGKADKRTGVRRM